MSRISIQRKAKPLHDENSDWRRKAFEIGSSISTSISIETPPLSPQAKATEQSKQYRTMFSASLLRTTARRLPAAAITTIKQWVPLVRPFATSTARPFTILGVQQIALGSTDKAGMDKLWIDIFGLKVESTHRLEKENVIEDILRVGAAKSPFAVEVDLMQPIDPDKSPKVSSA
jgi:hypothetical protein